MELLEYRFGCLNTPGQGEASPYGCVAPFRELLDFLNAPGDNRENERVFTAAEGLRYSSVKVQYRNVKDG